MRLVVDDDVARVAEFVTRTIPGDKLRKVARALVQLGELIWLEEIEKERYSAFGVAQEPMRPDLSQQQPKATSEPHPGPSIQQNDSGNSEHPEGSRS